MVSKSDFFTLESEPRAARKLRGSGRLHKHLSDLFEEANG
jgi:hypothetical protein